MKNLLTFLSLFFVVNIFAETKLLNVSLTGQMVDDNLKPTNYSSPIQPLICLDINFKVTNNWFGEKNKSSTICIKSAVKNNGTFQANDQMKLRGGIIRRSIILSDVSCTVKARAYWGTMHWEHASNISAISNCELKHNKEGTARLEISGLMFKKSDLEI